MKALYILIFFTTIITLLAGCNTTLFDAQAEEEAKALRIRNATYECCNATKYESGYYYNGYQENGWRYCVIRKD